MKTKSLLFIVALWLLNYTAHADFFYDLYIDGAASVCPGATQSYSLRSNLSASVQHWDEYRITITNGVILTVDGNALPNGPQSYYSITKESPLFRQQVDIDVRWDNTSGIIGKVHLDYRTSFALVPNKTKSKDVIIGLGDVGTIKLANYAPTCEWNELTYSIDPVLGATSYTWSNSLGWTVKSISADQRTITFNATSSTTTGSVNVTARTSACGSILKTKSLAINREASVANILGPSVLPAGSMDAYSTGLGTNYSWTVPSGWTVRQSPYYTNSVHISSPPYNGPGGYVTVSYTDPCGVPKFATKFVSTEAYEDNRVKPIDVTSNHAIEEVNLVTQIYPNPTSGTFFFQPKNNSVIDIKILNSHGIVVYRKNGLTEKTEIDLKALSSGIYYIEYTSEGKKEVKKLIKN